MSHIARPATLEITPAHILDLLTRAKALAIYCHEDILTDAPEYAETVRACRAEATATARLIRDIESTRIAI